VHHEIELVVALSKGGRDIPLEAAMDCVWGYGVGLDMTRRDLQGEAKKLGRPWEVGKAFERSAPCSPLVPAAEIGHPERGAIWLRINGETRQEGDLAQMIWKTPEMISLSLEALRAEARRPDHDRHARRGRAGGSRRPAAWPCRRRGGARGDGRLTAGPRPCDLPVRVSRALA
jgi:hypothetical protein